MINWLSGSRFGSLHVGDLPLRQPRGHWGPCLRVSGEVVGGEGIYRFIQFSWFSCQFSWESSNLYGILKDLYPFERNLYGDLYSKTSDCSHVSRWTKCISAKVTPFCTCLGARPVVDGFVWMENGETLRLQNLQDSVGWIQQRERQDESFIVWDSTWTC